MSDQALCCDFCFNSNIPLYEGGFDPPTRICGFCAALAVAQTTPVPQAPSQSRLLSHHMRHRGCSAWQHALLKMLEGVESNYKLALFVQPGANIDSAGFLGI